MGIWILLYTQKANTAELTMCCLKNMLTNSSCDSRVSVNSGVLLIPAWRLHLSPITRVQMW